MQCCVARRQPPRVSTGCLDGSTIYDHPTTNTLCDANNIARWWFKGYLWLQFTVWFFLVCRFRHLTLLCHSWNTYEKHLEEWLLAPRRDLRRLRLLHEQYLVEAMMTTSFNVSRLSENPRLRWALWWAFRQFVTGFVISLIPLQPGARPCGVLTR